MKKITLKQLESSAKKSGEENIEFVSYNGDNYSMLTVVCSPHKELFYFINNHQVGRKPISRDEAKKIINT